jgi:hypothetical protein
MSLNDNVMQRGAIAMMQEFARPSKRWLKSAAHGLERPSQNVSVAMPSANQAELTEITHGLKPKRDNLTR